MTRSGRLLRDQQRDATLAPCGCGHSPLVHHELPADLLEVDHLCRDPRCTLPDHLEVVARPNPAYEPLHFHCGACDCVVVG